MLAGDRRALARLITRVENRRAGSARRDAAGASENRPSLHGRHHRPPGAGKSTLVDRLTAAIRKTGATVSVVAVDPTSPFTGGAVLGDRIRMQAHTLDPGVFIRSMATRGSLGGLARATAETQKLLDAAGFDWSSWRRSASGRPSSTSSASPIPPWSCWCPNRATASRP